MRKTIWQPIRLTSICNKTIKLLLLVFGTFLMAQTGTVKGKLVDEDNYPIKNATITIADLYTQTNNFGSFALEAPAGEAEVVISYPNKELFTKKITITADQDTPLYVKLTTMQETALETVVFQKQRKATILNSIELNPKDIDKLPSLSGGIEDILKTLPYVSSNTELSSQYMVRGGNFDENLVYVNGIEIYRPQLVRSGEQEGLSFLNPHMTANINFSAGGFEAKYGDKMSSVLNVIYKKPTKFETSVEASLMGGSLTIGSATKDEKLSGIVGIRYQDRSLLFSTLSGGTTFRPKYFDIQTNIDYRINQKLSLNFLSNVSINSFNNKPTTKETYFIYNNNPLKLNIYYNGQEKDQFNTQTAALSINYRPLKNLNLSLSTFGFHTLEQEHFDIVGAYAISEIDPITGGATSTNDIGGQIRHARNDLDILVTGIEHKGKYNLTPNQNIEWGVKYQKENVRDLLNEWQYIDSAGYNTPRPYQDSGYLDLSNLKLIHPVNTGENINSNRFSGYGQYAEKLLWHETKIFLNAGLRGTYWSLNNEFNISPRLQIAIKPNWQKDMLFRLAAGVYYQPPFYKEIRALDGTINYHIKSQKSIHYILGNDYEFKWKNRAFKITSELYYKYITNLIPYYVDNVRIKYTAQNNAVGQSYGLDLRLNGEFVPGIESWLGISYARSLENIDNQGYIPRATDQRLKANIFFQDYMPKFPSFKVNLNLVYAVGLPNGAPLYTNPYQYQATLPDYKRVDVGLTKVFFDENKFKPKEGSKWHKFKELSIGIEGFNIFDIRNTVSNEWITDVSTRNIYTVPNKLTGRFFNLKIWVKF